MKSPVSHRIVKLALVTGLAALFALLTVGSVLATTPPDRTSHLLSSSAAQLLPRPSAAAHTLAVGVTPTAEDDPVNPHPADRDNANALQPLLSDVPAESGGIFFTGSVPLISSTLSQDWGDFDRDGNLDLALGTSRGISIYHNLKGQLVLSKTLTPGAVYGVRWADLNGDDLLELVTVRNLPGANGIYRYTGSDFISYTAFASSLPLARVLVLNGKRDLIASTSAISTSCSVLRYQNSAGYFTASLPTCVSSSATAGISAGDFNKDGNPDLVLGGFPGEVKLLINNGVVLTETQNSYTFDTAPSWPYDFAWGDYDGDGRLDLAAAFPLQRQVRIYHNEGLGANPPFELSGLLPTQRFMTPLSIDWGDFNGDGALDLAVADDPPRIYFNVNQSIGPDSGRVQMSANPAHDTLWSIRAAALNNSSLSLMLGAQYEKSQLYPIVGGHLPSEAISVTGAIAASSLAWGDIDGNGRMDLVLGGAAGTTPSTVYWNVNGSLAFTNSTSIPGSGQRRVALANLSKDDRGLEVIIGDSTSVKVYTRTVNGLQVLNTLPIGAPVSALALGDFNSDEGLDLLVGTEDGRILLYRNTNGTLGSSPIFTLQLAGQIRDVAWVDYDHDYYMDFAVAVSSGYARVYHNNQDGTFTPVVMAQEASNSTAVAWADFNDDGLPDLAVGTDGQGIRIHPYNNIGGSFGPSIWASSFHSHTTSLAWGDWDNDGRPDLAVGNDGEPAQVFANLLTESGPQLIPVWTSSETGATADIAWGDVNNDGYLDLGAARRDGLNGVYYNTSVLPWQVPNPSSYISIVRPGKTFGAYLYSSPEFLPGYFSNVLPPTLAPTVTIYYSVSNPAGTLITNTLFEFSLDGGSNWSAATPASTSLRPITQTAPLGRAGRFIWNAREDTAFSDNVLFRIRVVDQLPVGPFQRAASAAASPPFRVRAMDCQWPTDLSIDPPDGSIEPLKPARFVGILGVYSGGPISYTWIMDDKNPDASTITGSKEAVYIYNTAGFYTVTLEVNTPNCPGPRPVKASLINLRVGNPLPTLAYKTYLPLVQRSSTIAQSTATGLEAENSPHRAASVATSIGGTTACIPKTILPPLRPTVAWLTGTTGYYGQPVLNYDGSRFAFWSTANLTTTNPDGNIELYYAQVNRVDSCVTFTQITSSTGNILEGFNLGPTMNAAGDRVAFFSDRDLTGDNPDHNFEVFLAQINPSGSISVTQVTDSVRNVNALPTLNAAGDRIAFVSDQDLVGSNSDGNQEIFVAALDAAGQVLNYTQLTQTSPGTFNDEPAISANGQRIAFVRGGDQTTGIQEIFVGNVDQPGSLMTVTASPRNLFNYRPTIGGGGSQYSIAYAASDLAQEVVHFATLAGTAVNVTPVYTTTRNSWPALNVTDGSRLVVISGTQDINVLVPGNQSLKPIYSCASTNCPYAAISGDGMHVIFTAKRALREAYYETATLSLLLNPPTTPVVAGTKLTRTIVLTNSGPGPADGVDLLSTLRADGTTILSVTFTTSPAGICSGSDTVHCRIAGLSINSPAYITLTTQQNIDAGRLAPVTLAVDATAWQASSVAINPSIAVVAEADLKVSKAVAPTAVAGELVTYTLTISNSGPSHAQSVALYDVLPDDLAFSSQHLLAGPTFALTNTAGTITDTIGSLQTGVSATIQIVTQLSSTAPVGKIISNTAVITSITADPLLNSNQSLVGFRVTTRSNLTVTKSAPVTVTAGLPLTYTIIVTNAGPSAAEGVLITDSLPASVTVSSPPASCFSSLGNTQITCTLATLDKETSYTIRLVADTDSDIDEGTTLTNRVMANAVNAVRVVSNTATTRTEVGSYLYITKTATTAVTAGEPLTYTITVENRGPSTARHLTVTDLWPGKYISYTGYSANTLYPGGDPGGCGYTLGQVICFDDRGLPNGRAQVYYLYATTYQTLPLGTIIINTATITASGTTVTRVDTAATTIDNTLSRLTAAKSADAMVLAGNSVHYTIVVTNSGPSYAPFVTVTDQLPTGVTFLSSVPPLACSSNDGTNVSCNLQNLYVGAASRQTITLVGGVSYTVASGTVLTNMAGITASNAAASVNVTATTAVRTSSDLAIEKTATKEVNTVTDPQASPEIITYTIVVTNIGPSLARDVVLTDALPVSVTYLSQIGANPLVTPTRTGQTLTWLLDTIVPSSTSAVTFTARVITSTVGPITLTNNAYVTATTAPRVMTASASTYVIPRARLAITKTSFPQQPIKNTNLTYQITVTNLGPSVVPSATISDVLPVGAIQFSSHFDYTPGCSEEPLAGDPQYVICTTPSLALGGQYVVTITARISNQAPAVFTNTAYATSTIATAVVSDSVVSSSIISTSLTVTKTLVSAEVVAGQNITYAITVASNGPSAAPTVIVTDTLPAEVISAIGSTGCGPLAGDHKMTCVQALVPMEAPYTFTITGQLTSNLSAPKIITNEVQATTPATTTVATDSLTTTVNVRANLQISKLAAATARASDLLTYTIVVTNAGPSLAPSIRITDVLPVSVTYLSQVGSTPSTSSPISTGRQLTWTLLNNLVPSATQIITFNVRITNTVGGSALITNTAYVTSTSAPAVATDPAVTQIQDQANLVLTKTLLTPNPIAGGNLTYGITVTNLGPSPASSVTITDRLPSEVTFVSASSSCPITNPVVTCNAGNLLLNQSWSITITGRIKPDVTTAFINTAYATSTVATALASNSASTTPAVQVNLQVTKTLSPLNAVAVAGSDLTYTITVGNQGLSTAGAVVITDQLPSGQSFSSASLSCTPSGSVVTCPAVSLNSGEQRSITMTGRLATSLPAGTVITNTAYASATVAATGASDLVTTVVTSRASLRIAKLAESPVLAGNPLTYTILITNDGPSLAPIITMTDRLSPSLTIGAWPGTCNSGGNVVTCTLTNVDVGFAQLVLTPTVNSSVVSGTQIINRAVVTGSNALNIVTGTITTTVWTAANLAIGTAIAPTSVYSNTGGDVRVSITFTNTGPSDARSVFITETLDVLTYTTLIAKPAYVSGPTTGVNCGGSGRPQQCTWSISILTATLTGTIELTATAPSTGVSYSQGITAYITSTLTIDPYPSDNSRSNNLNFVQVLPRMYWAGLLPIRWPVALISAQPRDFWSLSP